MIHSSERRAGQSLEAVARGPLLGAAFVAPDYDLVIEPLPVCVTPERPQQLEAFHNGRYSAEQFATHYGRIFEQRKDIFEQFGLL